MGNGEREPTPGFAEGTARIEPASERRHDEDRSVLLARLIGLEISEILPRIQSADALGVQPVCMRRLRERALIIDPERAFARGLVEVAFAMSIAMSPEELSPGWIQNNVDRALSRLIEEDREAERADEGNPPRDNRPYRFVHDAFATPLDKCRSATVEFNALPHRTRFAFLVLLVDNTDVDECLDTGLWTPEELRMDIWTAFRVLGHITESELEEFRNRKDSKRNWRRKE